MFSIKFHRRMCLCVLFAAFILAFQIPDLHAQTKQLLAWQQDLASLQNASGDELLEQRVAIAQIREAIEIWLKFHQSSKAALQSAPPQPWGVDQVRSQVSDLRKVLDVIVKEDPNQPFNLGLTLVSVTAEASLLSPVTESLGRNEITNRQLLTMATALEVLPGVSVDHPTGMRNEAYARIRGFSSKGQVPLYMDGIPEYIPFDGFVDFNRFLTSDFVEVQVSKGYASPTLGPNGLAGAINVVTREPEKKFEANALIGTGSGDQALSSLSLGSRWDHFYVQGSFDWFQRDFIPLSGNFTLNKYQTNDERNNSASRDEKWSGRIAWMPKGNDQYSFSYINQKGKKDGLQYIGPGNTTYRNFWRWPYWNKNSYYLITNTGIGETSSIKFRGYYDQFRNQLDIWDDATFSTMKLSGSEHSLYNDYADGASTEFTTHLLPRNTFSASASFKDDTHRSIDIYPAVSPFPKILPQRRLRDQQTSIGLQDVISLTSRLHLTAGFSADHLKGLYGSGYNASTTAAITAAAPLPCAALPKNTSFSECVPHIWTYNPQISASYNLSTSDTLFAVFSDRARFPVLKDMYNFSFGTSFPNPDLGPEHSRNWDIGYSHNFAGRTMMQIEYFSMDLRDAIQSVPVKDPQNLCPLSTGLMKGYCNVPYNVGKELHQGTEISLRSTPMRRLTLDASYSYLSRTIAYDYSKMPDISQINLRILTYPVIAKNKFISNATVELPHHILGMATFRYEGGIRLQDTNISVNTFKGSYGVVDIGTIAPIKAGIKLQAGIKNLFDRDYYYAAGYPEAGRNWYFNLRYSF